MEPLLVSDEPNWVLKAIYQLEKEKIFGRIETDNGFIVLPLPNPDNLLLAGYAIHDAPNAGLNEQKIEFPWVVFFTKYPAYQFAYRATKPIHNPPTVLHYESLFGKPQDFASYYFRVHSDLSHLQEYYRLVSEVLAHYWLAERPNLPLSTELIRETARALSPYFKGAPVNLRDYYIQEGKPFLDWLMKYL